MTRRRRHSPKVTIEVKEMKAARRDGQEKAYHEAAFTKA
jgi:hypothetical protein